MNIVQNNKEKLSKAIDFLKHDISSLRTGRANPAIVEDVMVEAYGVKQPIRNVASIVVQDAKTLAIEPWDKSIMSAVETAIRQSPVGINPVNDGRMIRLPLPELTQDRRRDLIKVLGQKLENAKISIRKIREEIKDEIELSEKENIITEDEKFKQIDELEKAVKEFNEKVKEVGEEKEKEINTI